MYKKLGYRWQTARRVSRSFKVTKHGTIPYVRYGFLLVWYSNFVPKMRRFSDIRLQKNAVTLKPGLRSVKVIDKVTIR